jgi:hypothetical protein
MYSSQQSSDSFKIQFIINIVVIDFFAATDFFFVRGINMYFEIWGC